MPQPKILFPSWHIEDVARDLNEQEAAAILNAYAIAFHPAILSASGEVPHWIAAQSPGEVEADRIFILPEPSRSKLTSNWLKEAEEQGAIVLAVTADRQESLQTLREHQSLQQLLQSQKDDWDFECGDLNLDSPQLGEDFQSLGVVYLMVSLLSQAMYHYDNIEETRFADLIVAAGRRSLAGYAEQTLQAFTQACEQLLESREKFYPVEAHLIDLCLYSEGIPSDELALLRNADHPVNLLTTAKLLQKACNESSDAKETLATLLNSENGCLVGGEFQELPTPLLPLSVWRSQLQKGLETCREAVGCEPKVWGRMQYGLSTQLPLILKKSGIESAYHLVLDDGSYPDEEQSHFAWEGRNGQVVQSLSRIPTSVENASSLLKIPERLAEAMNHDHLACAVLARWPKIRQPWHADLIRVHRHAPILGKFVRLDEFLTETDDSGHYTSHAQREYLSPFLEQLTGRDEADAISRFAEFWKLEESQARAHWYKTVEMIMRGAKQGSDEDALPKAISSVVEQLDRKAILKAKTEVDQHETELAQSLAHLVTGQGTEQGGWIVFNTISHSRRVCLEFPRSSPSDPVPVLQGPVKHLQVESERTLALVDLPSCGFAAISSAPENKVKLPKSKAPLAGEYFLQNEFFHAKIDPDNGGIQRFRAQGSNENLISERLVYRLDGDVGTVPRGQSGWGGGGTEPRYTKMVAEEFSVLSEGPLRGELEVRGVLVDAERNQIVARFTKRYTATRGMKNLSMQVDIEPSILPAVLPDRSYYALRFAWNSAGATVKGSLQGSQFEAGERRLECTGPVEIEDEDHRLTLVTHHRPFHRREGMRMLDSLLIVHGETERTFRCDLLLDADDSESAASSLLNPPAIVSTTSQPKTDSAWLFHVSAPTVQLINIQPDIEVETEQGTAQTYRFDFLESAGKHANVKFSTFRPAVQAWEIDFAGNVQEELKIEGDQILFETLPCDYLSIRIRF